MLWSSYLRWSPEARPTVVTAGRFAHDDQHFRARYIAPAHHCLHLYEYACTMRCGPKRIDLRPGMTTISPAGTETRYHLPRAGYHWCVHFRDDHWRAHTGRRTRVPTVMNLSDHQHEVADQMARIAQLRAIGRPEADAAAASNLQTLLMQMALWHCGATPSSEAVDDLISMIQRWLNRPLRVEQLARDVGMSQNYLARRFRQRMGMTIPAYILRQRIERAKLLLTTTTLPIKLIGARVGLPDAQHFNKQFRRLGGKSPTAWRASGN